MRNLTKIIEKIIELIPEDYTGKNNLEHELRGVQDSLKYAAPETLGMWWERTSDILGFGLGDPNSPWKRTIANLFTDRIKLEEV